MGRSLLRVTATPEHPLYVVGKGWVGAGSLCVGDALATRAGPPLVVQKLTLLHRPQGYVVFNLTVSGDHTYFVGKAHGGIWVHNAHPCDAPTLLADRYGKLASTLFQRGSQWGFPEKVTASRANVEDFADIVANYVAKASEVRKTKYKADERLFHISSDDMTVVTDLNGKFVSIWKATAAQLNHYRTGMKIG